MITWRMSNGIIPNGMGSIDMQLSQFSDTVQELCHEGHALANVKFNVGTEEYKLKSVDVTPTSVTFQLQLIEKEVQHEGFLDRY